MTFGALLENTVPEVPSAQWSGTLDAFVYAAQSGIGAAGPTQTICCAPEARPVLSSTLPICPTEGALA